ncbi:MAG TPA: hypothetical protein VJ793_11200 [Anaerolineae bacterium]|nr:hypothetical protein [Anaerolineae bacterium]
MKVELIHNSIHWRQRMCNESTDAREYAYAALRNFEAYGQGAAQEMQRTRELIAENEQFMGRKWD